MLPITDSNLKPDALVDEVLPAYGLGTIGRCRLHARGLNDTYKAETSRDETYFFRIGRCRRGRDTRLRRHPANLAHGPARQPR